jgi:hypothetical protein
LPSSSGLPGSWGTDSPSPTSRAPSAVGSAANRLVRPRTSEGGVLEGQPTAREHLGYILHATAIVATASVTGIARG